MTETAALANELREEGIYGAVNAIVWRNKKPGAPSYLLIDPSGRVLAGDMTSASRIPGWHRVQIPDSDSRAKAEILAHTTRYPDGTISAVGEEVGKNEAIREALFGAVLPIGFVAILCSVTMSLFITMRALRQMDRIIETVRSVEEGNFNARILTRSPRNDVDELAIALNKMLDRIDDLVAAIRRVSAEIAHDLRTPLTHALHGLDQIRQAHDGLERAEAIELVQASLAKASRLFDATLALAQLDAGISRENFALIEFIEVVENAVHAYQADIEASGRSIVYANTCPCIVNGDAALLTQAVANLLDNALKHSREAAIVAVRTRCENGRALVTVADNGPGIRANEAELILRPFSRLNSAQGKSGTGLGLAIAKSVARLHQGDLTVEHLDPGLSVTIGLPMVSSQVRCTNEGKLGVA